MDDILRIVSAHLPTQWVLHPQDIVVISGSRIEGLGNRRSDIDVFLIFATDLDRLFRGPRAFVLEAEETYLDYESYALEEVRDVASRLNRLSPDAFEAIRSLTLTDLDFYYRMAIAQPCANEQGFRALQADFTKETLARLLHVWTGLRSATELHCTHELWTANRVEAAFLAASDAVAWAVDSFLALHGEAFPSLKWRFEKLQRVFGATSDVYLKAWDLKSLGTREISGYIAEVTQFCEELGMGKFLVQVFHDIKPRRSPLTHLFKVVERYYLVQNKMRIYETNLTGKYIWEHIDGQSSVSEIATKLAQAFNMSAEEARYYVDSFIHDLETRGIVMWT